LNDLQNYCVLHAHMIVSQTIWTTPGAIEIERKTHSNLSRYLIVVIGGTRNPHQKAVARDISGAILQSKAGKGVSTVYWSKEEQEAKLTAVFEKWSQKGGVWSEAAKKVRLPKSSEFCN
jgi:hypothetical protein